MHETFDRVQNVKSSSDRVFGIVIAVFFSAIGGWPVISGDPVRWWAIGVAAAFGLCALAYPRALHTLNKLWTKFGLILHKIMNPLLMGIIFFAVITPTGIIMRLAGKDPLRLNKRDSASTYWIERSPPGPDPESMKNQF